MDAPSLVESSMVSSHASVGSPGSGVGDRLYEAALDQRYRREEMIRAHEAERRALEDSSLRLSRVRHPPSPASAVQSSVSRLHDEAMASKRALEEEQRRAKLALEAMREGFGTEVTFTPRVSMLSKVMAASKEQEAAAFWDGSDEAKHYERQTTVEDRLRAQGEAAEAVRRRKLRDEAARRKSEATPRITTKAAKMRREGDFGSRLHTAAKQQSAALDRRRSGRRREASLAASRVARGRVASPTRAAESATRTSLAASRAQDLYRDALKRKVAAEKRQAAVATEARHLARSDRHVLARSNEIAATLTTTATDRLSRTKKDAAKEAFRKKIMAKAAEDPRFLDDAPPPAAAKSASARTKALRHEQLYRDARRTHERRRQQQCDVADRELDGCTFAPRLASSRDVRGDVARRAVAAAEATSAKGTVAGRASEWLKRRDEKRAAAAARKSTAEMVECTFKPNTKPNVIPPKAEAPPETPAKAPAAAEAAAATPAAPAPRGAGEPPTFDDWLKRVDDDDPDAGPRDAPPAATPPPPPPPKVGPPSNVAKAQPPPPPPADPQRPLAIPTPANLDAEPPTPPPVAAFEAALRDEYPTSPETED